MKRSVESRAEKAGRLFGFAVDQFHNDFTLPSSLEIAARRDAMLKNLESIEKQYLPKRKFKRREVAEDEEIRVQVTLLEYSNQAKAGTSQEVKEDVAELLSDLTLEEHDKLEFDDKTRESVFFDYSTLVTEFSKDDKEVEHQNQVAALREAKVNLEKRLELIKEAKQEKEAQLETLRQEKSQIAAELTFLKEKHSNEDKSTLEKLTALLQTTEDLKTAETKFKQDCKDQLVKMQEEIDEYERLAGTSAEEENRISLDVEKQNFQAIRLKLAKKNRQIVVLQRQLDNVPNRAELAQYQRRFLELYNQVSAKHRETKQFYTLYNTLSDTKLYLEKEIGLLNSIFENFTATTGSSSLREQFLNQLEAIVVGIKENKVKLQKRCAGEKEKKKRFDAELDGLFEVQRKYTAAIKQLKQLLLEKQDDWKGFE